jgi:hypothetical protein
LKPHETNKFAEWQGGRNDPPWALLEHDQSSSKFALIDRGRLPPGVEMLRNPSTMTAEETELWLAHILRGQSGELQAHEVFQFLQTRPGQFDQTLRTEIHPDARLHYPPECLAYLRFLETNERTASVPRPDELPSLQAGEFYASLSPSTGSRLRTQLGNDEVGLLLLEQLARHDQAGPHHVSKILLRLLNVI